MYVHYQGPNDQMTIKCLHQYYKMTVSWLSITPPTVTNLMHSTYWLLQWRLIISCSKLWHYYYQWSVLLSTILLVVVLVHWLTYYYWRLLILQEVRALISCSIYLEYTLNETIYVILAIKFPSRSASATTNLPRLPGLGHIQLSPFARPRSSSTFPAQPSAMSPP